MQKLILIHNSSLTQRWYDYLCFPELTKAFDVEFWDCSAFVFPKFIVTNPIKDGHVVKQNDMDELEKNLQHIKPGAIVALDIHRCEQNFKVLKLIAKYHRQVLFINFFSNTINQSRLEKFIDDYTSWKNLRRKFFSLIFRKMFHTIRISCEHDAHYRINHPDYECYLRIAKEPSVLPYCRYAIYIDNNFPYHPEIKYRESYLNIDQIAKGFYNSLNAFFERVEKEYNCEVVIAAHPAAHYNHNPYNGRKMIVNKTGLLVRDSIGVLMHTSNAVSFAYLYRKPVVLLHNKSYRSAKMEFRRLKECSQRLCFSLVDTDDHNASGIFNNNINENDRMDYIHRYLVDTNDTRSNKEKLIEYIQEIEKRKSL